MKGNLLFPALVAALFAGTATTVVYAQLSAQITGTIQDTSTAVVPGATVTVVNENTGIKWEAKTNQSGIFTVPLLQPGMYGITVQADGFRPIRRSVSN
jgi:hypothetical protein